MCAFTLLPTEDWTISTQQVQSTTAVNHRTSRPVRETSPDSEHSSSSLLPFSRSPVEPAFLPPSSWCLQHAPDGFACLKNIYPFSLNVTDSLPSVHILTTTSTEVAWRRGGWHCHFIATRFSSCVCLDSLMLRPVCVGFLSLPKDQKVTGIFLHIQASSALHVCPVKSRSVLCLLTSAHCGINSIPGSK